MRIKYIISISIFVIFQFSHLCFLGQHKGFIGGAYLGITGTSLKGEQNQYLWNYNGKTKSITSYSGGIYVSRFFFNNKHKLRFEMKYTRKGAIAYSSITRGPSFENLVLHYIELPLLYEQPFYVEEDIHFLYLGISYGKLIKQAMNVGGDILYSELGSLLRENDYCWNLRYKLPFLKNKKNLYMILSLSRSLRSIHEKMLDHKIKVYNRVVGLDLNYEF